MSDNNEMRIDPPAGWRWVEKGERKGDNEWRYANGVKWSRSAHGKHDVAPVDNYCITPIAPAEPETVDAPVEVRNSQLVVRDPNDNYAYALGYSPNIVGPKWAFAGFVWPDGVSCERYFLCLGKETKYATAVRFRRVKGGAE